LVPVAVPWPVAAFTVPVAVPEELLSTLWSLTSAA